MSLSPGKIMKLKKMAEETPAATPAGGEPMEASSMKLAPAGQVMSDQPEAAKASARSCGGPKHSLLEMCSGGYCEQENVYTIHSKSVQGPVLLTAKEKSGGCARFCCNPHHSLVVKISHPSTGEDTFDYSLERPGLCSAKPMMCCRCAWTQGCSDEMILHKGDVGTEQPGEIKSGQRMARVRQATCFEAFFNPTLFYHPRGIGDPQPQSQSPVHFWRLQRTLRDFPFQGDE
eukprot:g64367.t1